MAPIAQLCLRNDAGERGPERPPTCVTGKDVRFGRPLFNLRGTRVTGTELASSSVDDAGKVHLVSDFVVLGFAVHGAYDGTLGAHGGTFAGTQS